MEPQRDCSQITVGHSYPLEVGCALCSKCEGHFANRVEDFSLNFQLDLNLNLHLASLIAFDTGHLTNLVANHSLLFKTLREFLLNPFLPGSSSYTVPIWRIWPVKSADRLARIVPV
jgi:hypothetical protein